ncbi:hypothetical protein CXG81DRAFT_16946 [Caulochytrium protostelioides]|uniref:Uncharacterized protein n=1 Tax=Caulochytrium protostelioides TaxID=1555241 RepID=A0A4V1IVC4_9FUNG|nr:hypothetical protein CXG81DRAFT_16946 [Caulochytrium protostelioides]|eukprot:RKP03569.1 hypothetical protein CXG81DRAFT_16946 [Caulochytrium protostelioides]
MVLGTSPRSGASPLSPSAAAAPTPGSAAAKASLLARTNSLRIRATFSSFSGAARRSTTRIAGSGAAVSTTATTAATATATATAAAIAAPPARDNDSMSRVVAPPSAIPAPSPSPHRIAARLTPPAASGLARRATMHGTSPSRVARPSRSLAPAAAETAAAPGEAAASESAELTVARPLSMGRSPSVVATGGAFGIEVTTPVGLRRPVATARSAAAVAATPSASASAAGSPATAASPLPFSSSTPTIAFGTRATTPLLRHATRHATVSLASNAPIVLRGGAGPSTPVPTAATSASSVALSMSTALGVDLHASPLGRGGTLASCASMSDLLMRERPAAPSSMASHLPPSGLPRVFAGAAPAPRSLGAARQELHGAAASMSALMFPMARAQSNASLVLGPLDLDNDAVAWFDAAHATAAAPAIVATPSMAPTADITTSFRATSRGANAPATADGDANVNMGADADADAASASGSVVAASTTGSGTTAVDGSATSRASRQLADLELSRNALLALNDVLEGKVRTQKRVIRDLQDRMGRLEAGTAVMLETASSSNLPDREDTIDSEDRPMADVVATPIGAPDGMAQHGAATSTATLMDDTEADPRRVVMVARAAETAKNAKTCCVATAELGIQCALAADEPAVPVIPVMANADVQCELLMDASAEGPMPTESEAWSLTEIARQHAFALHKRQVARAALATYAAETAQLSAQISDVSNDVMAMLAAAQSAVETA